jgi:hypothetical protein
MKKAKPTTSHASPVKCPVLPIALRVGELWDAHAGAEEREHDATAMAKALYRISDLAEPVPDQIWKLRNAVEETASFERARSPAGALFQVALAHEAIQHVYASLPAEQKPESIAFTFTKLIRLLDSVAIFLRGECTAGDYLAVKGVVEAYFTIEQAHLRLQWSEEIPELAKEYRRSSKLAPAAV